MKNIQIEKIATANGEKVKLQSPYHPELPAKAKALGGRYADKAWYFDPRDEDRVRALALEIFGTDGTPTQAGEGGLVTLRVSYPQGYFEVGSGVFVAGRCIARAYGRDSGAKLGEGVVMLTGSVNSSGSRARWGVAIGAESVFEIRDVPRVAAEAAVAQSGAGIRAEIVEAAPTAPAGDVAALKAEKERLLARIAEIDAILASGG